MNHLIISDLHPGRFGKGRKENTWALMDFARHASKVNAEFWVNGDLDEDFLLEKNVIDRKIYREECHIAGRAFEIFCGETGKPVQVIRGNHDHPNMNADTLNERFRPFSMSPLQFHVHDELIARPNNDLVFTHGHIIDGIREARQLVEQCLRGEMDPDVLLAELNSSTFDDIFRKQEERLDRIIHPIMKAARFLGLAEFVENAFPRLQRTRKAREQREHEQQWNDELVLPPNKQKATMTDTAGRLGSTLGAKVVAVGHDHVSDLVTRRIWKPGVGEAAPVIVANSGDFVSSGRKKTAVLIETEKRSVSLLVHDGDFVRQSGDSLSY